MVFRRRSCSSAAKTNSRVNPLGSPHPFGGTALALSLAASVIFGACLFDEHDQLLADVKSDREEVRAQAIRRLSEDPWPNDEAVLFQAASDPSSMVRLVVAEILWASDDPKVQNLLATFLSDEVPEIQRFGIKGLLRKPTAKNLAYLRNAYLKQGWATRRLIGELATVDQLKSFIRSEAEMLRVQAEEELQQNAPPRQESAARRLGQSGSTDVVASLMAILNNPASDVAALAGASDGLATLDVRDAIPRLVEILVNEPHPALRSAVMNALATFSDADSVKPLAEVAEEKSESEPGALNALAQMAATGGRASHAAKAELCQLILKASPDNADDRASAVLRARATCDLSSVAEDLSLGGTATLAALKILTRIPVPNLGSKILSIFEGESEPELVAQAWRALGPLAAQDEKIQAVLTKKLDAHFATYDQSHKKWIPPVRIHGLWPKDEFASVNLMAEDEEHHHHSSDDEGPEISLEDLKQGTNLDAKDLEKMVSAQKGEKLKGQGKKKGFSNLMAKLDKAAKARTEALGMKQGTDLSKVFAYGGDLVPDDSIDGDDIYAGMLSALAYMPTYPLSAEIFGNLWSSFQTRRAACELAGSRYGVTTSVKAPISMVEAGKSPTVVSEAQANSNAEVLPTKDEAQPEAQLLQMETRELSADELVQRCLRSRIQEDQEAVLRGLVRRGNEASKAIEAALFERSEQRAPLFEALRTLGQTSDDVVKTARSLVADGGLDGLAALSLLVAAKDDSIVPQLIKSLENPALRERAQVIEALGVLGGDKAGVVGALELELFSESMSVRASTLRALNKLGKLNDVPKAQALSADYSAEVRQLISANKLGERTSNATSSEAIE